MSPLEDKEYGMQPETAENWENFTPERVEKLLHSKRELACGYLVWTRRNHGKEGVYENIAALQKRQITYLRSNISWCEWHEKNNREWIAWYIREYAKHFHVWQPAVNGNSKRKNMEL